MPDVLHIVIFFHNVDELFHQLDLLFGLQLLIVLGNHFDLGRNEGVLVKLCNHIVEIIGSGVDGEYIFLSLEIAGISIRKKWER